MCFRIGPIKVKVGDEFKFKANCSLYYKHITIVNDDTSIVNKLETSLIDDARVIIYDRYMYIVQTTDLYVLFSSLLIL